MLFVIGLIMSFGATPVVSEIDLSFSLGPLFSSKQVSPIKMKEVYVKLRKCCNASFTGVFVIAVSAGLFIA